MNRLRAVVLSAGMGIVAISMGGCIAGDPAPVTGALGVTVDDAGQPVVVIEACQGSAEFVDLTWTREDLAAEEMSEDIGKYTPMSSQAGTTRLELSDPGASWKGEPFAFHGDARGVIAGASTTDGDTLRTVMFYESDLADLSPEQVSWNSGVSDNGEPLTSTLPLAEFSATVCSEFGDN